MSMNIKFIYCLSKYFHIEHSFMIMENCFVQFAYETSATRRPTYQWRTCWILLTFFLFCSFIFQAHSKSRMTNRIAINVLISFLAKHLLLRYLKFSIVVDVCVRVVNRMKHNTDFITSRKVEQRISRGEIFWNFSWLNRFIVDDTENFL